MLKRNILKTPSAKKIIQYDIFTSNISEARLRLVQQLTRDSDRESQSVPDAVLCIQGIDSRYNAGSQRLLDYLLFDFHDACRQELKGSGISEEILDDLMIMVKPQSVHVYCNPTIYPYLLPFISPWRNLAIHCLTEEDYEDGDVAEDFKVRSLVEMLLGCKLIAVPYSIDGSEKFEMMALEQWPMIQAMGLEEYRLGGFFTMSYKMASLLQVSATGPLPLHPIRVMDISDKLASIYRKTDPAQLETVITKELPLFERQWSTMISIIDSTEAEARNQLRKEVVEEAFKSYFVHGLSRKTKHTRSIAPFVYFGKLSIKESLTSTTKGDYPIPLTLKSCGVGGNNAPFMVCQAVAPSSPLSCSRTYFFTDRDVSQSSDLWTTQRLYSSMVEGVLAAIRTYSQTYDLDEMREAARRPLQDVQASLPECIRTHINKKEIIKITLEAFDTQGRVYSQEVFECPDTLKTLSMVIYDVPSIDVHGAVLGSLLFSETFLDSRIILTHNGVPHGQDSAYVVLTAQVPRVTYWRLDRANMSSLTNEQPPLYNEVAYVNACDIDKSIPVKGTISVYSDCMVVGLPSSGDTVVKYEDIRAIQVYRRDTSQVCVVIIQHRLSLPHLGTPDPKHGPQILLYLHPKTKAFRIFISQILPRWKAGSWPVQQINQLPSYLVHSYTEQQHAYECLLGAGTGLKARPDWHTQLKTLIPITIISGIPGSFKDNLASSIKKYTEEHNRWILFTQRLDSASTFVPAVIHAALSSAVQSVKKKGPSSRTLRILVITPGFTDISLVVQAILAHPDPDVASSITIGAVTCSIDPYNTFISQRLTFPVLLNQCQPGWVNNVVVSSIEQDSEVTHLRQLIRTINPHVPIFVAEQGEVTRSSEVDLILSTTAFNDPAMVRCRHLSIPNWTIGVPESPLYPPMNEVIIRFAARLDRSVTIREIKALHKKSLNPMLSGNIYHLRGKVTFLDSDEAIELQFTTRSNILTWTKIASPPAMEGGTSLGNFMVFTGCNLQDHKLKEWLKQCTQCKSEKKRERSVADLTEKELQAIHKANHLNDLPHGWFYNGNSFVNMSGEKTMRHPGMDDFIQAYLDKQNKDIATFNAGVEENRHNDIFL